MVEQVYRPRRPKESPLWQCLCAHFYDFIQAYPEKYEKKYGFLKPVVEDVVNKYLDCGDLTKGFARIYCENCKKSMLLPLSCIPYYTSSVLSNIPAVLQSFPASGFSYMQSPLSLSLRYPTGKVPFARRIRTMREVVPSLGASSSAVR